MAQPRFKAPSLQELILAAQSGPTGAESIEAAREGTKRGLGTSLRLQEISARKEEAAQEMKTRAQELKLKVEAGQREQLKLTETTRAAKATEGQKRREARPTKTLKEAQAEQALAQAEFLRRKPGSPKDVPLSDVALDIQAEKEAQAFGKTLAAGAGRFGTPNLPEIIAVQKELRLQALKDARDQAQAQDNFVPVQKADGTTGKVPQESLDAFLQANPGSKVVE